MVLDGSTNTVIASPSIGGWVVAVNPTTGRIYFTSGGEDSILIIDPSTNTLAQTVPVGTTPLGVTANPSTDVVCAYNFWDDSLSVIQDIVPTATLTINTQDTSGQAIAGYYTVLYDQSNALVGTGFSPSSFTVNAGQTYTVQVDNYGPCTFDHWADTSSTNPQRTLTIPTNTQLTAIYNCTTSTLSVSATTLGGTPLSGYYVRSP